MDDQNKISVPSLSKPPVKQTKGQELEGKLEQLRIQELEERAKKLAGDTGVPFLDLTLTPVDKSSLSIVPEEEAKILELVIIDRIGKNLRLAATNPKNPEVVKKVGSLESGGFKVKLFTCSKRGLNRVLENYKEVSEFGKTKLGVVRINEEEISNFQKEINSLKDIQNAKQRLSSLSTTQIVEVILAGGLKLGSSDIHFEPEEVGVRLRFRIDGVLQDVLSFEPQNYTQILNRIKLVSGLKLNIHNAPQDGRFTIRLESIDIEIRVSVLPGGYGENIVMRILDPRSIKQSIEELGMRPDMLEDMKQQLKKTTGAILTTGPTGSGKTTTLYAFLQFINETGTKVITIEDPIEYHVKGIAQTQVKPDKGYTFANGLRAIVRQDPDVILVGEIRDKETSEIALNAALTGHLVFSTIHTNDAAGTIPRLIDLGVKPQIIAPSLNVAMAQRLVRQLCKECKKSRVLTAEEFKRVQATISKIAKKINIPTVNEATKIFEASGCQKCDNTGYKGRIAVFEAFFVDRDIEKLILKSPAIFEVRDMAIQKGMITLLQDGYLKVIKGVTDLTEVERVIGVS